MNSGNERKTEGIDRRKFLMRAAAAGTAAALRPAGVFAQDSGDRRGSIPNNFTRIFEDLPPFAEASPEVQPALMELGKPGGLLDAKDPLKEGPIRLITNPELSPNNLDGATHTAGVTFLGQFLDHDMTFDTTSRLGIPTRPEQSPNTRTPSFDLDSVYGGGPTSSPELYDSRDRAKFRVESGGQFEDLPRRSDGTAIIPDPRNDENLMIAGLQVAFLLFHNRVVDWLRDRGDDHRLSEANQFRNLELERLTDGGDSDRNRGVFEEARRLVTWHYHWIILNEFLPGICGPAMINDVVSRGPRFYTPRRGQQLIPVEYQAACYRFGHSLVRPSYRANLAGDKGAPFFGFIFDPAGQGQGDPVDLRGGARAKRRFIGWQTFFDFGGAQTTNVRFTKTIDTKISTPLFNLPLGAIASGDPPTSLPQRNLLRHLTWSIPSGQAIAEAMRIPALSSSQLSELTLPRRAGAEYTALVLHPQGSGAGRRSTPRRCRRQNCR